MHERESGSLAQAAIDQMRLLIADDEGGSLVEYALLLALIALVTIAGMKKLEPKLANIFTKAGTDFKR